MKNTILGVICLSASFVIATPVALAVDGRDCNAAGGNCGEEAQCSQVQGYVNKGQLDCGELGPTFTCCAQGVTPPPVSQSEQPQQQGAPPPPQRKAGSENFSLQLPSCVSDGKCELDDIVQTGVAFANLLMSLSGVLFFAAFIYGGAMYLLSFGRSDWVSKGTKAMTGAMIGMGIVLSAWTIVNYIATTISIGSI